MNICDERHDQTRQVTYRGAKGSHYHPVWLVCDSCMEMDHFGGAEQIDSMNVLNQMTMNFISKVKQQAGILV